MAAVLINDADVANNNGFVYKKKNQIKNSLPYPKPIKYEKKETEGNYIKRGEPYFLVINSTDNIDEITISSGYIYKEDSEIEISFGLKKINAFTYKK